MCIFCLSEVLIALLSSNETLEQGQKRHESQGMVWKTIFPYSILTISFHSISIPY